MIYLGIDPGISGAMAWLGEDDGQRALMTFDTPIVNVSRDPKKTRNEPNLAGMRLLLSEWRPSDGFALIERVHPHPGEGVRSVASLAASFWSWRALLMAMGIPHDTVEPGTWKRALGMLKTDEDAARAKVCQLFPEASEQFGRKKDHHRADAALIAYYARGQRMGM